MGRSCCLDQNALHIALRATPPRSIGATKNLPETGPPFRQKGGTGRNSPIRGGAMRTSSWWRAISIHSITVIPKKKSPENRQAAFTSAPSKKWRHASGGAIHFKTLNLLFWLFVFFGKMVCNSLMAVDAGLAFFLGLHVLLVRSLFLQLAAHGIKVVAVAAFPGA